MVPMIPVATHILDFLQTEDYITDLPLLNARLLAYFFHGLVFTPGFYLPPILGPFP